MSNTEGKISKITGKVMSDSLDQSFTRIEKQLPDVLIPDFVMFLKKLDAHPPFAVARGNTGQKQHVIGWMNAQLTHGGETSYHRDNLNISSRTSYNHWNNPWMALWLAEALGEDPEKIRAADEEAFKEPNKRRRAGIVRKHFPFDRILELMGKGWDAERIIIRTKAQLMDRIDSYVSESRR